MSLIVVAFLAGLAVIVRRSPILWFVAGIALMLYGFDYYSTSNPLSIMLVVAGVGLIGVSAKV